MNEVTYSLEKLEGESYVGRRHPHGGDQSQGSDFDWACTIERQGDTAIIKGALFLPSDIRKSFPKLAEAGFKKVKWFHADGTTREFDL